MINQFSTSIVTLISLMLLISCGSTPTDSTDGPKGELPRDLSAGEQLVIEADRSFSYELFRKTVDWDTENENVFISPLSISMALAMTLNGAEGQTFEDMRDALYLGGMDIDEINDAYSSLAELLMTVDPNVTVKIANSIWYREGLPVEEEFKENLREYFRAEITGLDFSDPASVDIINEWVSENTDQLIEKIIDDIPNHIVMYLINALYFQGDWLTQFDPDDTRMAEFYLESGETTEVDMMHREGQFATYLSNEVSMIELPYGDSLFSMTVVLPGDSDMAVDQFVKEKVTSGNLEAWRSNLTVDTRDATVKLPKFELEYELEYKDILSAMGMEIAFDEGAADFKGMADVSPQNLFLDEVKHKTFIRVDEEGSEAAAVTSVGVGITSLPPQVIVNRPFVFIIHDRESGANLFMGKVKNIGN